MNFRIGSLFGIPLKLDVTFLLILPLFAYLIGDQVAELVTILNDVLGAGIDASLLAEGTTPWLLGFVAAVGLFVGVVLHELGHALSARYYGFPTESITLWLFGGIASFSEMPEDWRKELLIAVAGPVVSVLVGVACFGLFTVAPADLGGVRFVLGYLAVLNVALAIFNMLPAFPMDGGRVLRALFARSYPYARATQLAASVGKGFAVIMGIFGLLAFNVILIGIAFFVYIAAAGESQQVTMRAAFQDVTVADVMTPRDELDTVTPRTTLAELIERMFRERHTSYPVLDDYGELVGLVTLGDARDVKPVERDAYRVEDVMSRDLELVSPDTDAMAAIDTIQNGRAGRLLVVDDGQLVGLISRTDLMTAFDIIKRSGTLGRSEESYPAN